MDLAADGVCGSEMCPEPAGPSLRTLPVPERRANARHGRWQVAHDELRLEPQDGVPGARQRAVAPSIGPLLVIAAIDLDDEAQLGGEQVDDEPTEQGHLPAKCDAELPAAKCREEASLGSGGRAPHVRSALFEQLRAMSKAHGVPPGPGKEAGLGSPRRRIRDVRSAPTGLSVGAWHGACATSRARPPFRAQGAPRPGLDCRAYCTAAPRASRRASPVRAHPAPAAPPLIASLAWARASTHLGEAAGAQAASRRARRPSSSRRAPASGGIKDTTHAVAFVGVMAFARAGHAQGDAATREATARFREGLHLHDAGQDEDARLKFAQAYAVLHTPNILFNLARSEQLTGHSLEALDHYKQYLRDGDPKITGKDRDTAKLLIAELVRKVGHVTIDAPTGAKVTVDGAGLAGEAPFADPIDVTPGKHAIVAKMGDTTKNVDVVAGEGETVAAKFVFADAPLPLPTPPPVPPPPRPPAPEPPSSGAKLGTAIALGGAALASLGVGVGFAIATSNDANRISQLQAGYSSESCFGSTLSRCANLTKAADQHRTDTGGAEGFLVAGGALGLGALATVLLWPSPVRLSTATWLVPLVTGAGGAVELVGRF